RSTGGADEGRTAGPGVPHRRARDAGDEVRPGEASVLRLQRSAGNAAVGRTLRTGGSSPRATPERRRPALDRISVQRHASFEHTLLGNTPPSRLGQAAVTRNDRAHLIKDLWLQTVFFLSDAGRDP